MQEKLQNQKEHETKTFFPIVEDTTLYTIDRPAGVKDSIIHYKTPLSSSATREHFMLLKEISSMNYLISLNQNAGSKIFSLDFKTKEYEYARTNLDPKSQNELFMAINDFLETVYKTGKITEIEISPASAGYTATDLEECIKKIIEHPDNYMTREEILKRYRGGQIFDRYEDLYNKNFNEINYNDRSNDKKGARERLFKMTIKKYLRNWDIQESPYQKVTNEFSIVRKKEVK